MLKHFGALKRISAEGRDYPARKVSPTTAQHSECNTCKQGYTAHTHSHTVALLKSTVVKVTVVFPLGSRQSNKTAHQNETVIHNF